jgi:hypothetical protein
MMATLKTSGRRVRLQGASASTTQLQHNSRGWQKAVAAPRQKTTPDNTRVRLTHNFSSVSASGAWMMSSSSWKDSRTRPAVLPQLRGGGGGRAGGERGAQGVI